MSEDTPGLIELILGCVDDLFASGSGSSRSLDGVFFEMKQQRVTDTATIKTTTPATAPTMTPTFEPELLLDVGEGEPEGGGGEGTGSI
jgi:hypothetical protein